MTVHRQLVAAVRHELAARADPAKALQMQWLEHVHVPWPRGG